MITITGIGDSIVDTVGRCGVGDTTQWLYKLMQELGETNISIEPLPEFGITPNILINRWPAFPGLVNGDLSEFQELTNNTYTINMSSHYPAGTQMFAVRVFTQNIAFTLRAFTSMDGTTWSGVPDGTIMKETGHSLGWSFCSWMPKNAKYLRLEILGTMNVAEVQLVSNVGNDRGSCLNKMVGQNYTVHNVGLGSQRTDQVLLRFARDVIDVGTNTVIILAGINDLYQNVPIELVQKNLLDIYDLADSAGIIVIPCTLLPYTGDISRFEELRNKIEVLNTWIRATAAVRRYGIGDWFNAMEDPANPGRMYAHLTCDGVHLNVQGNALIVQAFDLSQLSLVTHDFYAIPLYMIPFTAYREDSVVTFELGNNIETSYEIYMSYESGVDFSSTLVRTFTQSSGETFHQEYENAYFKVYGVTTGIWSEEVYVEGVPLPPAVPDRRKSPMQAFGHIPKVGWKAFAEIMEQEFVETP